MIHHLIWCIDRLYNEPGSWSLLCCCNYHLKQFWLSWPQSGSQNEILDPGRPQHSDGEFLYLSIISFTRYQRDKSYWF